MLLLAAKLCLFTAAADAKGGGGGRSSGSRASGSRASGSGASGRTTSGGRAVPASCRSCYYGAGGMFYHRVFFFSYMGRSHRCYSCGTRGGEYDIEQDSFTLQTITGGFNVTLSTQPGFSRAELENEASPGRAQLTQQITARISSVWWQWHSSAATRSQWTPGVNGMADEFAIELVFDNITNTTASVSFVALFESPEKSATEAATNAATLYAGCTGEARCVQCGVPSTGTTSCNRTPAATWANASCAAECADCATQCDSETVPGSQLRQGPKATATTCSPNPTLTPYLITHCQPFANGAVVLTSQMGDVIPADDDDDSSSILGIVFGFFLLLIICCCAKSYCDGRQRKARAGRWVSEHNQNARSFHGPPHTGFGAERQPQPVHAPPGPITVQAVPMIHAQPVFANAVEVPATRAESNELRNSGVAVGVALPGSPSSETPVAVAAADITSPSQVHAQAKP